MTLLLVGGLICLFVIAVLFPHAAKKVQHKTNERVGWLKRWSNFLWNPLTWWAKNSLELARRSVERVSRWGRTLRQRLPF